MNISIPDIIFMGGQQAKLPPSVEAMTPSDKQPSV